MNLQGIFTVLIIGSKAEAEKLMRACLAFGYIVHRIDGQRGLLDITGFFECGIYSADIAVFFESTFPERNSLLSALLILRGQLKEKPLFLLSSRRGTLEDTTVLASGVTKRVVDLGIFGEAVATSTRKLIQDAIGTPPQKDSKPPEEKAPTIQPSGRDLASDRRGEKFSVNIAGRIVELNHSESLVFDIIRQYRCWVPTYEIEKKCHLSKSYIPTLVRNIQTKIMKRLGFGLNDIIQKIHDGYRYVQPK